jgi:hypothetical protein
MYVCSSIASIVPSSQASRILRRITTKPTVRSVLRHPSQKKTPKSQVQGSAFTSDGRLRRSV